VRSEGFYVNEKTTDTSRDRTFQFVAQHLNRCATAVPTEIYWSNYNFILIICAFVDVIIQIIQNAWYEHKNINIEDKLVVFHKLAIFDD